MLSELFVDYIRTRAYCAADTTPHRKQFFGQMHTSRSNQYIRMCSTGYLLQEVKKKHFMAIVSFAARHLWGIRLLFCRVHFVKYWSHAFSSYISLYM